MKNSKKETTKSQTMFISNISFDNRLKDLKVKITPSPKYEESNKLVSALDLSI